MLKRRYFRLSVPMFLGISGICQAVYFDPFPTCSEAGKADSTVMAVLFEDVGDSPTLHRGSFPTVTRLEYAPGSCLPKAVLKHRNSPASPVYTTQFHERVPGRIYDFTISSIPDESEPTMGTDFYSFQGSLDSSIQYSISTNPQSGLPDTQFNVKRYLQGPGYALIEAGYRGAAGPWTRTIVDSIVVDDSGATIHSVDGENRKIETTRCRDHASTYICETERYVPVRTDGSPTLETRTWFLSQGRPDSLQLRTSIRSNRSMEVYTSTRYYWASGSTGIKTGPARRDPVFSPGFLKGFDILGRIKAWRHTRY